MTSTTFQSATTSKSVAKMSVTFGMVVIPVKLFLATDDHSISFKQVTSAGERIKQRRYTESGREIDYADLCKGYEQPDKSITVLTEDDMASLSDILPSAKTIDVHEFVSGAQIDPLSLSGKSYYLAPETQAGTAYGLLRDAMARADQVAVVTVTLRNRESVAIIRAHGNHLVLHMLSWADEVRTPTFTVPEVKPTEAEQNLADQLVASMANDVFTLDAYEDHYTAALAELVHAKAEGTKPKAKAEPKDEKQSSMADKLAASLKAAKAKPKRKAS